MRIISIFDSIDGEVNGFQGPGQVSTFVRLAGCNLRCNYCDTSGSWPIDAGKSITIEQILPQLHQHHITITGGEPLLQQEEVAALCRAVVESGRIVSIETNGSVTPKVINYPSATVVRFVMDFKSKSSGRPDWYCSAFLSAVSHLRPEDVVKFVIGSVADLTEVSEIIREVWGGYNKTGPRRTYGIIHGSSYTDQKLVEWILSNDPYGQLNIQLHKILWPNCKEKEER